MREDYKQKPTAEWISDLRSQFPTERCVDELLTRKMQRRHEPPSRTRGILEVKADLMRFLSAKVASPYSIAEIRSLSGGGSKEQYYFVLQYDDGTKEVRQPLVLRMQPSESTVETSRLREFEVLDVLNSSFPVPKPLWIDPSGVDFGRPALIYTFASGVSRPPSESRLPHQFDLWSPRLRNLVAPQFVRNLARFAAFDWPRDRLPSFDVPHKGTNEAVHSLINWFERVWEEDSLEPSPLITVATRWLKDNAPVVDHISIVHGDYRQGNFLFDADSGAITSILDWELVRLGDRHEDIAYALLPLFVKKDESGNPLVAGLCTREQFLKWYEEESGLAIDPKRLFYYEVLANWRLIVMAQASGLRCAVGKKSRQELLLMHNMQSVPYFATGLSAALRSVGKVDVKW